MEVALKVKLSRNTELSYLLGKEEWTISNDVYECICLLYTRAGVILNCHFYIYAYCPSGPCGATKGNHRI